MYKCGRAGGMNEHSYWKYIPGSGTMNGEPVSLASGTLPVSVNGPAPSLAHLLNVFPLPPELPLTEGVCLKAIEGMIRWTPSRIHSMQWADGKATYLRQEGFEKLV